MIIFQILAGMALIPLTVIALIMFNLYVHHKGYILAIILFWFMYAGLCSVLFKNYHVALWSMAIFILMHTARIIYLVTRIKIKKVIKHPLIYGYIRIKDGKNNIYAVFHFSLSFLRIIKRIPGIAHQRVGQNLEIQKLVDLILDKSAGTRLDIIHKNMHACVEVFLEVL